MNQGRTKPIGLARALAALLGAPLAAFALAAACVAHAPLSEESAFALGVHAMLPLWVALACALPLARTGARAWFCCSLLILLPGASLLL